MEFEFKITCWKTVQIDPKQEGKALLLLKLGKITSYEEFLSYFYNDLHIDDVIENTEESLTPEKNDQDITIEVRGDDGYVFDNVNPPLWAIK